MGRNLFVYLVFTVHCSSVPTVPLCPLFLCAHCSSVPTVPTVPLCLLFLCAYCSSVPTVPVCLLFLQARYVLVRDVTGAPYTAHKPS